MTHIPPEIKIKKLIVLEPRHKVTNVQFKMVLNLVTADTNLMGHCGRWDVHIARAEVTSDKSNQKSKSKARNR